MSEKNIKTSTYYNFKKSRLFKTLLLATSFLIILSSSNCSNAAPKSSYEKAYVLKVVDGDTLQVKVNGKKKTLRMIGVDTPETVHPKKPVQFYGKEASNFTKTKLSNKTVYLQKDVSDTDKYGRLLRYVWLKAPSSNNPKEDEIVKNMYNAILVKSGYAHAYTYQPDSKYSVLFSKLQNEAATKYIGLWNETAEKKFNSKNGNINSKSSDVNSNSNKDNGNKNSNSNLSNNKTDGKNSSNTNVNKGKIKGNKKSKIYHMPGFVDYNKINPKNTVYFNSEKDAIAAGYRRAKR